MSEKTDIEWATGEAFISLYNAELAATYLAQPSEAPDIHCVDQKGNRLNLEITMTEDRPGDIKALLGRSEDRSLGVLKIHLAKVKEGKADPFERVSCLSGNVSEMVVKRIEKKLTKRYGPNTALVVRDTSGVDWDWDLVVDAIKDRLKSVHNPFDMGIWILFSSKNRIFRVV
jgi:hypothetical protein